MAEDTMLAERPPTRERIPSIRLAPTNHEVLTHLGLLQGLAGNWEGRGFNLIARPDKQGNAPLFLELNRTIDHLKVEPIGSPVPNRGFAQDDIELFGLTYLQKISDAVTGGALHIEPGIWITQPATSAPPETAPKGDRIIARMATIPHGNAVLAEGVAARFAGAPTLTVPGAQYAGSRFPSFNSTPFLIPPLPPGAPPPGIQPDGTAETSAPGGGFPEYNLLVGESAANPRTPFGDPSPVPLPATIDGVPMQQVINDPIRLLQAVIEKQEAEGHSFAGTVLNVATQRRIAFLTDATPPTVNTVTVTDGGGGIENLPFLRANADTALVYATFWIEEVSHKHRPPFMQLQYAQMVLLNFPALGIAGPSGAPLVFSWPHVTVGTLRKTFG